MSIWDNFKKRGFKDILNPRKWLVFLKWKRDKKRGYIKVPVDEGLTYCRQVVYRSLLCRECVKQGQCKDCECKVPDNMLYPNNRCSEMNWLEMKSKEEFEKELENLGLDIGLVTRK